MYCHSMPGTTYYQYFIYYQWQSPYCLLWKSHFGVCSLGSLLLSPVLGKVLGENYYEIKIRLQTFIGACSKEPLWIGEGGKNSRERIELIQSQRRPQLILWGVWELRWPFKVAQNWTRRSGFCLSTSFHQWMWAA